MSKVSAEQAGKSFKTVLSRVADDRERIVVTRKGKAAAAMVPIEDLKLLEELEDRIDIELAKRAWAEQGDQPLIPWGRIIKEFNLE